MGRFVLLALLVQFLSGTVRANTFSCPQGGEAHSDLLTEMGTEAYAKAIVKIPEPSKRKGLTDDEGVAIHWYTTDEGSARINGSLNGTDAGVSIRAAVCLIESGLSKLPSYVGPVHRGANLTARERADLMARGAVVERAFTSTSWGMPFERSDEFDIQSSSGKDIEDFSEWGQEHEILFPPGARFEVLKSEPASQGVAMHWVMVEDSPDRQRDPTLENALRLMGENYKAALAYAIASCQHPLDPSTSLKEAEMVALYLFTDHLKTRINLILRQSQPSSSEVEPIVRAIGSAIRRLAPKKHDKASVWDTYEILTPALLEKYTPGVEIVEQAILQEVEERHFNKYWLPKPGIGQIGCRFEIHSHDESVVGGEYSATADDSVEALLQSGTHFKVLMRDLDLPDRCKVVLEEI